MNILHKIKEKYNEAGISIGSRMDAIISTKSFRVIKENAKNNKGQAILEYGICIILFTLVVLKGVQAFGDRLGVRIGKTMTNCY